jgi:hypothetical protein
MSDCDHMTSTMVLQIERVMISRCDWDCREVLVSVLRDDGVTVTYTAAELAALRERISQLEAAVREVQTQLRATSRNWDEDCLYRADDILTNALADHPVPEPVTL